MRDYYLRTDTVEEMNSALIAAGLQDDEGNLIGCDIDHIGPIFWADGTSDPRWHTNLRVHGELDPVAETLLPILDPPPANPTRVWC